MVCHWRERDAVHAFYLTSGKNTANWREESFRIHHQSSTQINNAPTALREYLIELWGSSKRFRPC